jgi:hypothetical protein
VRAIAHSKRGISEWLKLRFNLRLNLKLNLKNIPPSPTKKGVQAMTPLIGCIPYGV